MIRKKVKDPTSFASYRYNTVTRLAQWPYCTIQIYRHWSRSSRPLDLPSNRLDELFIKFWTLEGAVTGKGAAITIWRLKPLTIQILSTMGAVITIHAFYCQWPIKSFTEITVSLAFTSIFFVNNSSRRSSKCPRTISLDDRD